MNLTPKFDKQEYAMLSYFSYNYNKNKKYMTRYINESLQNNGSDFIVIDKLSTRLGRITVYKSKRRKKIVIAIKGTDLNKSPYNDITYDLQLLLGNANFSLYIKQIEDILAELDSQDEYADYTIDATAHSLGSSIMYSAMKASEYIRNRIFRAELFCIGVGALYKNDIFIIQLLQNQADNPILEALNYERKKRRDKEIFSKITVHNMFYDAVSFYSNKIENKVKIVYYTQINRIFNQYGLISFIKSKHNILNFMDISIRKISFIDDL